METNTETRSIRQGRRRAPKRLLALAAAVVVVVLVASAATFAVLYGTSVSSKIDRSKYQAVFLTSGQVYFGKLESVSGGYLRLTDIYYLQSNSTQDDLQNADKATTGNVQLIKLGEELHGPTDEMIINKDEVLFFENLKQDGKVTQSIQQFKKQ